MRTVANRTEQEGKKMIEQLLKKKEVMAAANLGPAKLRELVKAGKFPQDFGDIDLFGNFASEVNFI
jgi:hypothetical protein